MRTLEGDWEKSQNPRDFPKCHSHLVTSGSKSVSVRIPTDEETGSGNILCSRCIYTELQVQQLGET